MPAVKARPWQPGSWGKGLMTPVGGILSWKTDEPEGAPHHQDILDRLPYPDSNKWSFFYIDPEGHVAIDHDNDLDRDSNMERGNRIMNSNPAFQNGYIPWGMRESKTFKQSGPFGTTPDWAKPPTWGEMPELSKGFTPNPDAVPPSWWDEGREPWSEADNQQPDTILPTSQDPMKAGVPNPRHTANMQATLHTGQIPGDENYYPHPVTFHDANPHSGINPSYLGEVGGNPVYIKPQGRYHNNDIAAERAAFGIGREMGVRMPHTVARVLEQTGEPAQISHDVGGQNVERARPQYTMNWDPDRDDPYIPYRRFVDEFPDDARRIALFDHTIDNWDRHMGNMVLDNNGQVHAIDHGGGFGETYGADKFYAPSGVARIFAGSMLTPEEREILARVRNHDLSQYGFGPQEQRDMQTRVDDMLNSGTFLPDAPNPFANS